MAESGAVSPSTYWGELLIKQHLRAITGLRFYAALGVVLFHCGRQLDPIPGLSIIAAFGFTGVSFFFVLSGFVLAWSHKPGTPAGQFYWRRFARVWPLHALTMMLSIGVAVATGAALLWPALPAVLLLVQAWSPDGGVIYSFNGVSWSLSCEMFFYLVFPLIAGRIARSRAVIVGLGAFAAMAVVAVAVHKYQLGGISAYVLVSMPLFRLGEFVIGICLALVIQKGWRPRLRLSHALLFTLVSYAALAVGVVPQLVAVAGLWMLPSFAAVILAAACGDLRGEAGPLRSRWGVRLGQWSFALYLIHELILRLIAPWVSGLPVAGTAAVTVAVVVASLAASGALYRWVERPVEQRLNSLFIPRSVSVTQG